MRHLETKEMDSVAIYKLMTGGISPRPIALVSTISKDGKVNLSPFSFFNMFGANPPVVVFSATRTGADASTKDTYNNIVETEECVIQAVTYAMVEQVNISSANYPPDVDEFQKSGFTPVASDMVKPPRVKESPFQMECKLRQMIPIGEGRGSANLAICEVIKFHVDDDVVVDGVIEPGRIDLVGRLSGMYYSKTSDDALFEVQRPLGYNSVGYDALPEFMRASYTYTANDLGKFANASKLPEQQEVIQFINNAKGSEEEESAASEEVFYRYRRMADYKNMLRTMLALDIKDVRKIIFFFEQTAQIALQHNDSDFALKTAFAAGLLQKQV